MFYFRYIYHFTGLEKKISEMQENYDQLEGLSTQEVAKIKHMV